MASMCGIDVASMCYRWHRCGIDVDRCGIDVASMWIDGGPKMKRKRKRKIKWNKGKSKEDQRGPKRAQEVGPK